MDSKLSNNNLTLEPIDQKRSKSNMKESVRDTSLDFETTEIKPFVNKRGLFDNK